MSSNQSLSQDAPTPSPEDCKVCGFEGHGLHFGVVTCRACAAFFRRYVVLNLKYKCLKNKARCSMDRVRRSSCRHCRFKKCQEVGMSTNNVQWHRDINANQRQPRKFKDVCDKDYDPTLPSTSKPRLYQESIMKIENTLYRQSVLSETDYGSIEKEVQKIFQSDLPTTSHGYFAFLGPLQKFVEGLRLIRTSQRVKDIQFENRLSIETLVIHWKSQAKNTSVLMMHCIAFRSFPLLLKRRMFRNLWKSVHRLERIQMSVELFRKECATEKILVISTDRAVQLDDLFFDIDVDENTAEEILQSYLKLAERLIEDVAMPLSQLKLFLEEVAFLILNFVFHDENIPKIHMESCEKFMKEVSDELHEYYRKKGVIEYARRIATIMKIVRNMRKIHYDDLAGVFVKNGIIVKK